MTALYHVIKKALDESRAKSTVRHCSLCSFEVLLKRIKHMQRNRELFYKRYSAGKTKLRLDKDITLNRALFGVEGCCEIIARAYEIKMKELGRL